MVGELRLGDGADDSVLLARDARLISGVNPELGGDVLYVTHHEGEVPTLWRTSTDSSGAHALTPGRGARHDIRVAIPGRP